MYSVSTSITQSWQYSAVFIFHGPFVKVAFILSVLRLLLYSLFKFSRGLNKGPRKFSVHPVRIESVYAVEPQLLWGLCSVCRVSSSFMTAAFSLGCQHTIGFASIE